MNEMKWLSAEAKAISATKREVPTIIEWTVNTENKSEEGKKYREALFLAGDVGILLYISLSIIASIRIWKK